MGIETAMIGSAIIGGVSSYTGAKAQDKANRRANALSRQSLSVQEAQQRFSNERYIDSYVDYLHMEDIYGALQEDLTTYYKNLSGDSLAQSEIDKIKEYAQKNSNKLTESLTRRGLQYSGVAIALQNQNDYNTEKTIANVRNTADARAIEAKSLFLGQGQQAKNIALTRGDNIATQGGFIANNISSSLNRQGNIAINQGNLQAQNYVNFGGDLQSLLGYYSRVNNSNNMYEDEGLY